MPNEIRIRLNPNINLDYIRYTYIIGISLIFFF